MLEPLASDQVTTIVGFTERGRAGQLYNSAAILHRGSVVGVYRKLYPAVNNSVYAAGAKIPVFTAGDLTFGILICLDSLYYEPARIMAAQRAAALFVLTNNGMPQGRGGPELVAEARNRDIARAVENSVSVVRADVAGRTGDLVSYGSSGIVDRNGTVLGTARQLEYDMVVATIKTAPREPRPGWDSWKNSVVADEYARMVARAYPSTGSATQRLQSRSTITAMEPTA